MASRRVNKVIKIPTSLEGNFFRLWVEFLTPLHGLTGKEKLVLSAFLKERYELSKGISDPILLDKVLMSTETREKIKKEHNLTRSFFSAIFSKLKLAKVITPENTINPKFIPSGIVPKDDTFQLLFLFNLNAENDSQIAVKTTHIRRRNIESV